MSAMSSLLGAKTSKTRCPPGSNTSCAARSARSFSASSGMCSSERKGQITSGTVSLDRRLPEIAEPEVDEIRDAVLLGKRARDREHAR